MIVLIEGAAVLGVFIYAARKGHPLWGAALVLALSWAVIL